MPRITVLLTSYNHEKFVGRAIRSVLDQTFRDFELLIVDDCSKDASWEVIGSFSDPRIIAMRNERNRGPERAFEIMLERARGEYVAVFHSDDLWKPDKLEKQVAYLDSHPDIGAVFTAVEVIGEDDQPRTDIQDVYTNVFETVNRSRFEWLRRFFYQGNCLCHPSVLIRRELYRTCGMVTDTMAQIPDFYKWAKLLQHCDIHIMSERLTRYRVLKNEGNTSAPTASRQIRSLIELYFLFESYYSMDAQEILKVFPQAEKYVVDGEINAEFALSQIFVQEGNCDPIRFLGVEHLARLLDGPAREQVERLYGYDFLKHIALTAQSDVFHLRSETISASQADNIFKLYWDTGEGYSEERCISVPYRLGADCRLHLNLEMPETRPVCALRIDPCDAHSALVRLDTFCADGEDLKASAQHNGLPQGGLQIFPHRAPQYIAQLSPARTVRQVEVDAMITSNLEYALAVAQAHRDLPLRPLNESKHAQEKPVYRSSGVLGRLLRR